MLLPYVAKLPSVLSFTDQRVKIFPVDLISRALQEIALRVLIFTENPKMSKILNFDIRENLVP